MLYQVDRTLTSPPGRIVRVLCFRVSLLDVIEGMGHHNAVLPIYRDASSEEREAYDERTDERIVSGTVESGEGDEWLSSASNIAEETAVGKTKKGNPLSTRLHQGFLRPATYLRRSYTIHCQMTLPLVWLFLSFYQQALVRLNNKSTIRIALTVDRVHHGG